LVLAFLLSALIGFEREVSKKPAGFRTHAIVSVSSCLATIISIYYFKSDPARIASGIITGIGFIGAGNIIASKGDVKGITTAASLWSVAIVGLACGVGAYILAYVTAVMVFILLVVAKVEKTLHIKE